MGIKEVLSAPRSPWQWAYVERVIGTIRREYLDHVIPRQEAAFLGGPERGSQNRTGAPAKQNLRRPQWRRKSSEAVPRQGRNRDFER